MSKVKPTVIWNSRENRLLQLKGELMRWYLFDDVEAKKRGDVVNALNEYIDLLSERMGEEEDD